MSRTVHSSDQKHIMNVILAHKGSLSVSGLKFGVSQPKLIHGSSLDFMKCLNQQSIELIRFWGISGFHGNTFKLLGTQGFILYKTS